MPPKNDVILKKKKKKEREREKKNGGARWCAHWVKRDSREDTSETGVLTK
jgi:hypothetical protein